MIILNKKLNLIKILVLSMIIILTFLTIRYIKYQVCSVNANIVDSVEVPIIMYHNISNKPNLLGKYVVSETQFKNDLEYIKSNGYTSITMTQLINYVYNNIPLPEKPIMITFDDSYESFYTYAYPLLNEYKIHAIISVIGIYSDEYTENEDHNIDYSHLNWKQIKELSENEYIEIQNHTYDMHQNTGNRKGCRILKYESFEQYAKALKNDIGSLQEKILKITGKIPNTFAYPYGCLCTESIPVLKEIGFLAALTCTEQKNIITDDKECLFSLGRFNRANGETSEQFFKRIIK